jgi:hypothetical protein
MNPITLSMMAIFALGSILLSAGIDNQAGAGAPPGGVLPEKAYVVFTKESWGCLEGKR